MLRRISRVAMPAAFSATSAIRPRASLARGPYTSHQPLLHVPVARWPLAVGPKPWSSCYEGLWSLHFATVADRGSRIDPAQRGTR